MPTFTPTALTPAETKTLQATATGDWARFDKTDPAPDRTIRAAFLRHLLLNLPAPPEGQPWPLRLPGLRISGAIIEGPIDLADATGPEGEALPVLALQDCDIPEPIDLSNARLARLSIAGSRFSHLNANHACIDGPFHFSGARPFQDIAWISADGLAVDGDLSGNEAILSPPPATSDTPRGHALSLQHAAITGFLDPRKLQVAGGIFLLGARIAGRIDCDGAQLRNPEGDALVAENTEIGGSALLRNGFAATGRVSFLGARIAGNLNCRGAQLRNPNGIALNAYNASIDGSLQIWSGASIAGTIVLAGTRISSECMIDGAILCNPTDIAIEATSLQVGNSLTLRNATIMGGLNLRRAKIGASLLWDNLRFPKSLDIDDIPITYDPEPDLLIDLSHATIAAALQPRSLHTELSGHIDLQGLRAGSLDDDYENLSGWGDAAAWTLKLDGMIYDRLNLNNVMHGPDLVQTRLAWLKRQDNFRPQPYRQLAKVLRIQGHPEEARRIIIAENDKLPTTSNPAFKFIWHFWGKCFGYGLSPNRAAITLMICLAIGATGTYYVNNTAQIMVLSTTNVTAFSRPGKEPIFLPLGDKAGDVELLCGNQINNFFYAVDVMLPIVPLHQESKCDISTEPSLHPNDNLEFWRIAKAIFSIIGKLITTLALITFSGILRPRDQD